MRQVVRRLRLRGDDMGVNKVEFGGETIIDLMGDTVTPQSLLRGYSAHNKAGELIEGLAVVPTKVSELENDSKFITETGNVSKTIVTFEQAAERANVQPGDDLETAFAKLSKYCADLKQVAFSGKYMDLEGRIMLTNHLLATTPGTGLDAVQGKVLDGRTSKIYMQTVVNSLAPTERFLKAGDNLNAYISPGTYYANGGDITKTLINKPDGLSGGFRLDIIETAGGGWLVQRIMDHNFPPNVFLRSKEGEYGLSNWVKLATNDQISQINSELAIKNGVSWKNAVYRKTSVFYYEGEQKDKYDLPFNNCIIIVLMVVDNRGIAIAIGWANGYYASCIKINRLHDAWQGWESPKFT